MRTKLLTVSLLSSALGSCTTPVAGTLPYLRVEDYYWGWQFSGAKFTPDTDAAVRIYDAPVPCGTSFCPSGSWESIGVIRSDPVGGTRPGGFWGVIDAHNMAARRHVTVTCFPYGQSWNVDFSATDTATNLTTADYDRATTGGFFFNLPRCP